jgi:hypothetical protein
MTARRITTVASTASAWARTAHLLQGHAFMENRNGLAVAGLITQASGTAERDPGLHHPHERTPEPLMWAKTADEILASATRFCPRTSGSGHEMIIRSSAWSLDTRDVTKVRIFSRRVVGISSRSIVVYEVAEGAKSSPNERNPSRSPEHTSTCRSNKFVVRIMRHNLPGPTLPQAARWKTGSG